MLLEGQVDHSKLVRVTNTRDGAEVRQGIEWLPTAKARPFSWPVNNPGEECRCRSNSAIERMRNAASDQFGNEAGFLIGVNGSYARKEATRKSDVDFFFLGLGGQTSDLVEKKRAFQEVLTKDLDLACPEGAGVFEQPLSALKISEIGGLQDDNVTITRRMLLLLEGEWVFNEDAFHGFRRRLLEGYLHSEPGKDKICLFMLNDIIRYWRTMCVDLEYKATVAQKAREIRLIKLRFSRMLLYISGVLAVGKGYGLSFEEKLDSLDRNFKTPPLERFRSIVGKRGTDALELYAEFLKTLDTPCNRAALESDGPDGRVFKAMSEKAGCFRDGLYRLLLEMYSQGNPTIRAMLL